MKSTYLLLVMLLFCLPHRADANSALPDVFYQVKNWRVLGSGSHYLDLGVGGFDVIEEYQGHASGAARIELRVGNKLWFVGPVFGVLANTDGGWFSYGGIYADIENKNIVITPQLSIGEYKEGAGKDLGGTCQFRFAVGLSWQFVNRARLGLQLAHISNAGLDDHNPGEEDILMTFGWPF